MGAIKPSKTQFCILDDVSGTLRPGRITLLLGPPGAGKSTLLNALAGRMQKTAMHVGSSAACMPQIRKVFNKMHLPVICLQVVLYVACSPSLPLIIQILTYCALHSCFMRQTRHIRGRCDDIGRPELGLLQGLSHEIVFPNVLQLLETASLSHVLQVTGDITYNGKGFDQFRAVHTASYVDQDDLHLPMLTVKETLDFASRVQGVGHKLGEHPHH